MKLGSVFDELRFRLSRPTKHHDFVIVTAAHDASAYIDRHLRSVEKLRYDKTRITHLIFDDASSDDTVDKIERHREQAEPRQRVELAKNERNLGGCANLTRGFRAAPPGSIVVQLDGDDWLPDPRVLDYLNRVYADPETWMTYNSWVSADGARGSCRRIPEHIVSSNSFRDHSWVMSHLHSFRAELFSHVCDESLLDPETGEPWRSSVDMSHYFPMLELCGPRARHLDRINYVYNFHDGTIFKSRRGEQEATEKRIRGSERYSPLSSL